MNKFLAERGICSRREAEKLIDRGAVKVNGKLVQVQGVKVVPGQDKVEVCQRTLQEKEKQKMVLAFNKPVGVVCSTRKTAIEKSIVLDFFPPKLGHIFPVGRLDKDTSGLLLVTNDGDLAFRLTHPSFAHRKKYLVQVQEKIFPGALRKLVQGVNLFSKKTLPAKIEKVGEREFLMEIREGRNRQIRRVCRKVGLNVTGLCRVAIGDLHLAALQLPAGKFCTLGKRQIAALMAK